MLRGSWIKSNLRWSLRITLGSFYKFSIWRLKWRKRPQPQQLPPKKEKAHPQAFQTPQKTINQRLIRRNIPDSPMIFTWVIHKNHKCSLDSSIIHTLTTYYIKSTSFSNTSLQLKACKLITLSTLTDNFNKNLMPPKDE
jgi:hypothetical protein